MEEEELIDVERKLVGRVPYRYKINDHATTLEADSGFGRVGAKMDPKTGALMYEKYEDWITKQRTIKEEIEKENIRFSDDSKAIIDMREREKATLSLEGDLVEHNAVGTISVHNLSDKDRIWDIDVGLRNEDPEVEMDFDRLTLKELDPGERGSKEYRMRRLEPSIAVEEVVTAHPDLPQSYILPKDQSSRVFLQLGLKNLETIGYSEVIVSKRIPKDLKNIIFPGDIPEDVSIEEGKLIWRIARLEPAEVRVLRYEGEVRPAEAMPIPIGDVEVKGHTTEITSKIVVTSFEAMCRNMYFIEADETEEPGEWACRFVCENTSQFEVEVLRVEVQDPVTKEVYLNLDGPGIFISPEERWESETWLVSQKDRPTFVKNLVLNVIPGIRKRADFDLLRRGGDFFPASLAFEKNFDRRRVEAKRETDITATLFIENTGAAELEQVIIRDKVPRYMMPPAPSSIMVERDGMRLTDNIGTYIEPDGGGPLDDKVLYIRIDDLSQFGGPLNKGDRITITYRAKTYRPEPNTKITAPAEVDARPYLPGPVITGQDMAGAPIIDVQQVLRKFSIGKSIEQGSGPGIYNIELLYRNRGNQPVSELVLKDLIPENFEGKDFSREPEMEVTPEGITILRWSIPSVDAGETMVISYSIKGEGEYHPRDAQIFYNS